MGEVTVVGGGLVGSLLALYLQADGFKPTVFESRGDSRRDEAWAGRSINLALSQRGLSGLEKMGVADRIREEGVPMYGRMIHHKNGEKVYQAYGLTKDQHLLSVSRRGLNEALHTAAEEKGITIVFNQKCTAVDHKTTTVSFEDTKSKKVTTATAKPIFGCDGAFSKVRDVFARHQDRFDFSKVHASAYKELCFPAKSKGEFAMEDNCLHIWPRHSYMLIALPNLDGSFTATLFMEKSREDEGPSFALLNTDKDVLNFFKEEFPDALPLMPTLLEDFNANPTSNLQTIKCFPWNMDDKILLLGDSAHAIVPFFGQGINCGFEDCEVFGQLMKKHKNDFSKVFPAFSKSRKPNADAIAQLALNNYIEMRHSVASSAFLWRKKFEKFLSNYIFPGKFIPLYVMVTFTSIPYATAVEKARVQDLMVDRFLYSLAALLVLGLVWAAAVQSQL